LTLFREPNIGVFQGQYRSTNIEWYVQDNWRVNNRLTLDYGMRFSLIYPQYDKRQQEYYLTLSKFRRIEGRAPLQANVCSGYVCRGWLLVGQPACIRSGGSEYAAAELSVWPYRSGLGQSVPGNVGSEGRQLPRRYQEPWRPVRSGSWLRL
jgi:hypothetical protein